jgi:hypothetical protein
MMCRKRAFSPGEQAAIANAIDARQREFGTVRRCARQLGASLTRTYAALVWPQQPRSAVRVYAPDPSRACPRPEGRPPPTTIWSATYPAIPAARPEMTHRNERNVRLRIKKLISPTRSPSREQNTPGTIPQPGRKPRSQPHVNRNTLQ